MLKRQDVPLLVALLAIAFALFLNLAVPSAENPKQPSAQQGRHNSETVIPFEQPEGISFWQRTLREPISLFTGVLALFTIALVGASVWQGRLTQQSIELARQEFIATHRPKLRVRLPFLKAPIVGQPLKFGFTISNIGDSSAFKVAYQLHFKMPPLEDAEINWEGSGVSHVVELRAGAQVTVEHETDFICPDKRFIAFVGGTMIFGGLVGYEDGNSVVRMTSFRRIAAAQRSDGAATFRRIEDVNPDLEYEG
jgi:hypothetical protein